MNDLSSEIKIGFAILICFVVTAFALGYSLG